VGRKAPKIAARFRHKKSRPTKEKGPGEMASGLKGPTDSAEGGPPTKSHFLVRGNKRRGETSQSKASWFQRPRGPPAAPSLARLTGKGSEKEGEGRPTRAPSFSSGVRRRPNETSNCFAVLLGFSYRLPRGGDRFVYMIVWVISVLDRRRWERSCTGSFDLDGPRRRRSVASGIRGRPAWQPGVFTVCEKKKTSRQRKKAGIDKGGET